MPINQQEKMEIEKLYSDIKLLTAILEEDPKVWKDRYEKSIQTANEITKNTGLSYRQALESVKLELQRERDRLLNMKKKEQNIWTLPYDLLPWYKKAVIFIPYWIVAGVNRVLSWLTWELRKRREK